METVSGHTFGVNRFTFIPETVDVNANEVGHTEILLARTKLIPELGVVFESVVFYVSDEQQQSQYIKMFKENGMDAIVKLTDTRRSIYKDAEGLFKSQVSVEEYEIVPKPMPS